MQPGVYRVMDGGGVASPGFSTESLDRWGGKGIVQRRGTGSKHVATLGSSGRRRHQSFRPRTSHRATSPELGSSSGLRTARLRRDRFEKKGETGGGGGSIPSALPVERLSVKSVASNRWLARQLGLYTSVRLRNWFPMLSTSITLAQMTD